MDIYTATEEAYKHGYENGYKDGCKDERNKNANRKLNIICPECNGKGESTYYTVLEYNGEINKLLKRKGICRTCNGSGHIIQTNADRIRGMSDEELAEFFNEITCDSCLCDKLCTMYDRKANRLLKWLQQPVEQEV